MRLTRRHWRRFINILKEEGENTMKKTSVKLSDVLKFSFWGAKK